MAQTGEDVRLQQGSLTDDREVVERLRNLADNLPGGMIYQLVAEGDERRFLYVSRGVENLFGISREEALADAGALYGLIEPEFFPMLAAREAESLRTGTQFKAEVAIRRPDGERRWLQLTSARRTRQDGLAVWDGIALDVTDRHLAEEERDRTQRRLKIATDAAAIGIWDWDPRTNVVLYSERAKEICGFPPGEPVVFSQLTAATHPDDLPWTIPAARRALDPAIRSTEVFRYRIIRADTGEIRWVLAHGVATFAEVDGKDVAVSYIGTLLDITEQKRAEDALTESEARLRLAVEAGKMAVWELDPTTSSITQSPQLDAIYGFPAGRFLTLDDLRQRYAPGEEDRINAEGAAAQARGDQQIQTEFRILWPDGSEHWLLLRAAVHPTATGPGRAIGVLLDITDRKRAEQRMELVARELQHRVKNTLAIIQTIAAQSFRGDAPIEDRIAGFSGRLAALAAATDNITVNDWSDAYVGEVATQITQPFRDTAADAFILSGPRVPIPSRLAIGMGMALHELCTNAVKYGALSSAGGRVRLTWKEEDGELVITWEEEGGPPVVAPIRRGFGTRLLEHGLLGDRGAVELTFHPEGVICILRARL